MDIGSVLMALRAEKGTYQKDLADYLEVSVGTISNYEQGIHNPDLGTLCRIADYYEVSVDYLLGRSALRTPPENLSRPLTEQYTIAEFINTVLQLDKPNSNSLIEYIELLKLRQTYGAKKD